MMIAQDEFNSADQRRHTLNAKSGPNPMMLIENQPRRQTQISKQKNSVVQHQRISVISKNNIRFN